MAYEYLVQRYIRVNGVKREDISPLWAVTFGAAAGYALWARSVHCSCLIHGLSIYGSSIRQSFDLS